MYINDAIKIKNHIIQYVKGLYFTGSIRRKEHDINVIDFITKRDLQEVYLDIAELYLGNIKVNREGDKYMSLTFESEYGDINIDIWRAMDNYEYKFMKWLRNMPRDENIYYRHLAKEKGLTLSDRGLKYRNFFINIPTLKILKKALKTWNFDDYKKYINENNIKI